METRPLSRLHALWLLLAVLLAAPALAADFRVTDIGERSFDNGTALAVMLSSPLDPTRIHDAHLRVATADGQAVRGAWVLADNHRVLYFPAIEPDATYKVQVADTLTAADGRTLGEGIEREVQTRPITPGVGFADQGLVLPPTLARGLPVLSINVAAVDIDFLRVAPDRAAEFLREFSPAATTSSHSLDNMAPYAQLVYSARYGLAGEPNKRATTLIPVLDIPELAAPGLYVAAMKPAGRYPYEYQSAYFFVSDMGLMARVYGDAVMVFVNALSTAEPLPGIEVVVYERKGGRLDGAVTDAEGKVRLRWSEEAHVILARRGDDVALLPLGGSALDLSEFAIDGRPARPRALFVYAPRDLYRPGEAVPVSALLRDHDGYLVPAQPLTAKLRRPDGQVLDEQVWQPGALGYYQRALHLPDRAQTGTWSLELRTDPASKQPLETFRFQVEEFLPERMRLTLTSSEGPVPYDQPLIVDYAGDYLYGAPAAGHRVDTVLVLEADSHPVAALPDFHFGDPAGFQRERRELSSLTLDAQGRAVLRVDPLEQRPGAAVEATVVASLFEHGGRALTRVLRRDLWPAPALVGVRPSFAGERAPPEGEVTFEIVKAAPDGSLLPAEGLDVALIKVDRDYYWMYDADRGWRSEYSETPYPVLETVVATGADGPARVSARVEHGHYRLEVRDPATSLTTRLPFVAGWSWEDPAERAGATRPDRVALSLDQEAYRAGDTVRLTLEPPHAGAALILVEGDRLLAYRRLAVPAAPTTVEIPVEPRWDRHDIYITAVVLRPASREQRITPNRAMGILHLPLDRRDRRLAVDIDAPAEIRPERTLTATVTVPDAGTEPVHVTLAAVDVGVLNITDFATPDPWAWFFAKRRLGVDARDLYGRVIEAFEGERAQLRFGGDKAITPGGQRPPATVRIVSLFTGPLTLDAGGKAQIPIEIPDFNGQLRLMAIVFGANRFGSADKNVIVAAPVVAELAMPRFLAPGDRSQVTLDLHNRTEGPLELDVALTAEGPLMLEPSTRQLTLDADAREVLRIPLTAAGTFGVGTLRLAVDGGEDSAIRRSWALGVRPPWPADHRRARQRLLPGESLSLGADALVGLIPTSVEGGLLVSARPALDLARALDDLLAYPYGCLEQTTSRAYPLLYADARAARLVGIEPIAEEQRLAWIEEAIERIRALQLPNGGFALWDEHGPEDAWLTAYVTDFLLDARDQGYSVPQTLLQNALERLQRTLRVGAVPLGRYAQNAAHLAFAAQAYGAYVLARVNQAPLGQLRQLYDKHRQDAASGLPLAHLGLALGMQGDQRRSQAALAEAVEKRRTDAYLGDYGSPVRDTAMIVHLLSSRGAEAAMTEGLLYRLDDALAGRRWLSTQERVAIFLAGLSLARAGSGQWQAALEIGPTTQTLTESNPWRWPVDPAALAAGLTLTNTSDRPLYTAFEVSGYPASRAEPVTDPMTIARSWYTLDGTPMDLADLAPGQMALVRLQLQSEVAIEHGLVVDLLPAGLEIENANLSRGESASALSIGGTPVSEIAADVKHMEFREDRFVAALSLDPGRTYDLFYLLRAVTPGEYVVPPPFAEDMYRPEIRAVGEGVGRLELDVESGGGGGG